MKGQAVLAQRGGGSGAPAGGMDEKNWRISMAGINCANCGRALAPAESACPDCGGSNRNLPDVDQALVTESTRRDEAARDLAKRHYQVEDGLTRVIRFTGRAEVGKVEGETPRVEPIKLLEINEHTVPSGIMPLYFGPLPESGIPYPTVIVEVTPEEYEQIQRRELKLPEGWEIGEELPKLPDETGGE